MEPAIIVFIVVVCCLASGFLIGLGVIYMISKSKDLPLTQTDQDKKCNSPVRNLNNAYFCLVINSSPGKPNFLTISTSDPNSSMIQTYSSTDGIDPDELIRPQSATEIKLDPGNDTTIVLSSANIDKLAEKTFMSRLKGVFNWQNDYDEFKKNCDIVAHILVSKAQDNVCITKIRATNKLQIDRFYKKSMTWMNAYSDQITPPFSIRLDNEELYRIFVYYSADAHNLVMPSEKGQKLHSDERYAGDVQQ